MMNTTPRSRTVTLYSCDAHYECQVTDSDNVDTADQFHQEVQRIIEQATCTCALTIVVFRITTKEIIYRATIDESRECVMLDTVIYDWSIMETVNRRFRFCFDQLTLVRANWSAEHAIKWLTTASFEQEIDLSIEALDARLTESIKTLCKKKPIRRIHVGCTGMPEDAIAAIQCAVTLTLGDWYMPDTPRSATPKFDGSQVHIQRIHIKNAEQLERLDQFKFERVVMSPMLWLALRLDPSFDVDITGLSGDFGRWDAEKGIFIPSSD